MYNIIFIDEVEDDIRRFQRYVHKCDTSSQFNVIPKIPIEDIDDFIEDIFSTKIDAIISDYQLAEYKSEVTYTGLDLINKILLQKENFPCFVMTSHDDEAVATSNDVNIIYIKGLMTKEDHVKITFLERVGKQIENYRAQLKLIEQNFDELIEKSIDNKLTALEEENLEKYDHFLEKSLNRESKIPSQLKSKKTLEDFHKLIENTDLLLKKLDENDSD